MSGEQTQLEHKSTEHVHSWGKPYDLRGDGFVEQCLTCEQIRPFAGTHTPSNEQLEGAWADFCRDTPVALRGPWEAFQYAYKSRVSSVETTADEGFQARVHDWMAKCFIRPDAMLLAQRSFRFIEEALELVQASGTAREDVMRLVGYVYGRPVGTVDQEIGGVMVTLAGLANSVGLSVEYAGNAELARCVENTDKIRAKDLAKPQRSPLPGSPEEPSEQLGPVGHLRKLGWEYNAASDSLIRIGELPPVEPEWKCGHGFGQRDCMIEGCANYARPEKDGARCEGGCHVHWSGWPASHHPNCTVNGTGDV